MRAEIISVGTELLLGDIVNTNAQFLAQELAALGFEVYYQTVVGDNAGRLRRLVSEAKDRSDVLVFTGGLGPTDDDLTKQTVAEAFGDVLVMSEEWLAHLEDMFNRRGRQMSDNNRKQALVPRRGGMLFNDNGTAPGVYFKLAGKYAFLLPGPPREMEPMFHEQVVPILETLQDSTIRSITLRVVGIGESDLENRVRQLLENSNPTAALYAKTSEVHIRITAKGPTAEMADLMCDEYAQMFRENLGDLIYAEGDGSLEETVVELLAGKGQSLATAESCTGGMLGQRITSVPGASAVYGFGAITYANDAKQEMLGVRSGTLRRHGAVSSQVAAEMAFGAAKRGLADYGVGITGVAGPDGGSEQKPVGLVYVALAAGREVFVRRLKMRTMGRAFVRSYATQVALDMVRRRAAGMPLPEAKRFTKSQQADFERVGRPRRRGGAVSRAILAVVLVLAVLAAILFGLYASRQGPGDSGANVSSSYAALQGLRYGSAEYTTAACGLVAQAASANPSVVGFVALPNRLVETTVAQANFSGQEALDTAAREAGVDGQVVMGNDATPAQPGANTVLLGSKDFEALLDFRSGESAATLSTFTYYTERQARVYRVFAFYLADDGEVRSDGFAPIAATVTSYSDFYAYMLGAKTRSLYDIAVPLAQGDSFMTLAVNDPAAEGRRAYLVGRLVRASETVDATASVATAAGTPLMPAAWYTQYDLAAPDETALFAAAMRGLMTAGATNQALQYAAGMPAADAYPVIQPPLETVANVQQPASTASSNSSAPASSSDSASSASGSDSASDSEDSSVSEDSDSSTDSDSTSGEADDSSSESISIPSSASIAPTPITPIAPEPEPQRPSPHRLTVTMNGEVVTDSALNILAQICQAEAAGLEPAAIRAVAIAAHSWILCQQGAGIEAPRVLGSPPSAAVLNAVREVATVVLSADGENPAFTPFYRLAATATNTPENLWGGTRSYLVSVDAPTEQAQEDWRQIITLSAERLAELVLQSTGIDLAATGDAQSWISEVTAGSGGYVSSLVLGGEAVTGADFWADILAEGGVPLLPSPAFEASYDGADFVFVTYGDGHGCGLSVSGASAHARNGWGHERILNHYFPGAELMAWE